MYILVWSGGHESPAVKFRYSLVDAQRCFDEWQKDVPEGDMLTMYSIDPNTENSFEIQCYEGEVPF